MDIKQIIKHIKQNSKKGLLDTTLELMQNKFEFNLIILIDNADRSKVVGHKFFKTYEQFQQYYAHLPMKYGYMYFHTNNNTYNAGASFFDQGWMCVYDGAKAVVTDFYDDITTSTSEDLPISFDIIFEDDKKAKEAA